MPSPNPRQNASQLGAQPTERQWQRTVLDAASLMRWWSYHTWNSMHSTGGFPDLVLIRPPRIVFVELKSERGKLRPEQAQVLEMLADCPSVEAYLWRPSDWPDVVRVLA